MRPCPSIERLFALAQERLSPVETERIEAHLNSGCQACRPQFLQLQKLVAATTHCELVDLPAWLITQAMNLFAWHRLTRQPHDVRQVPAVLVIDSLADGRLLGFRGTGATSRQLLYRAGEVDIDVSVDRVEQSELVDIMGQPMPLDADIVAVVDAPVKLLDGSRLAGDTRTNEFGEFLFDNVQPGLYDLTLELRDQHIQIVGLNAVCSLR